MVVHGGLALTARENQRDDAFGEQVAEDRLPPTNLVHQRNKTCASGCKMFQGRHGASGREYSEKRGPIKGNIQTSKHADPEGGRTKSLKRSRANILHCVGGDLKEDPHH